MDEGDTGALTGAPGETTKEQLVGQDTQLQAAREEEEEEEPPGTFSAGVSRSFADLSKFLKKPENVDRTLKGFTPREAC